MSSASSVSYDLTIFCDDSPTFLEKVKHWFDQLSLPVLVSTSTDEVLSWVKERRVNKLVADLVMPGMDGISLLEEVNEISGDTELVLLTGFNPNGDGMRRLNHIGARILSKTDDLEEIFGDLDSSNITASLRRELEYQLRIERLEMFNREWAEELVESLEQIPDRDNSFIAYGESKLTVSELLQDIIQLNPRGLEHIRLWKRARKTLRKMGKEL